jgi:CO dehydrogenase/acetyl-CoA synthase epsilon subunit
MGKEAIAPEVSGADTTGVAATAGEVTAFLDNDWFAAPEWVEELVTPLTDPRIAGVGTQVTRDARLSTSCLAWPTGHSGTRAA